MKSLSKFWFGALVVSLFTILVSFGTSSSIAFAAGEDVTCECLDSSCGRCEVETGVDFYTEKCGPSKSKVKSCKRPQCKAVSEYEVCIAKNDRAKSAVRAIASASAAAQQSQAAAPRSADVILAVGRSQLHRGEAKIDIMTGMKVFAGDKIVTAEDGRVRIRFPELSEIFISPISSLVITDALIEKRAGPSKRTIMLELQMGRVRSRVQGRYDDGESKFEIKTRSAVAGVRGTEFVVSYEQTDSQWKTEVRTLKGEVSLDGRGGDPTDKKFKDRNHATVVGGTIAAHVIPAPAPGASPFEIDAALARGRASEVIKMSDQDLEGFDDKGFSLNLLNKDPAERQPTAVAANLCSAPIGAFNQCSWTCEGNPKGSKNCRSDLSNVKCVRRLCRASGAWAEPTVLPVKDGVNCDGSGSTVVGDCGGYW